MKTLWLSAVLALALAPAAFAQTQGEMNHEAAQDYAKVAARLDKAYAAARQQQSGEVLEKLQQAQTAWVAHRDATAELEGYAVAENGTMAPLIRSTTKGELAEARIRDLRAKTKKEDGVKAASRLKTADEKLNAIYRALAKKLDENGRKLLRDSERLWLVYRDAEVAYRTCISSSEGADAYSLAYLTEIRIKELEDALSMEGL